MSETVLAVERAFEADGQSARAARRFIADALEACGVDPAEAQLLVSELVTNVVLHARTGFVVIMEITQDAVRVAVRDENTRLPTRVHPPLDATSGRGLALVQTVADDWGVEAHEGGKTVWFELESKAASDQLMGP